jgi:O-antigen/teichoic acid export membrane protein
MGILARKSSGHMARRVTKRRAVDLNTASEEELTRLPMVGRKRARALAVVFVMATGFTDVPHLLAGYALVGVIITTVSAISLDQVRVGRIALVGHGRSDASPKIPARASIKKAFVGATPYCFCTIFYLVYSQGVVAIIERWLGREAAAMYNVAFLIVAAVYLIPNVVYMKYLVSKIFRWWTQDRQMFSAVFHVGIAANAALGMVCMLAVIASAPFVIPMLFGSRYAAAVPILVLLSTGIPIRFIQHTYGATFFSQENMKREVCYLGAAAISCLALSLLLIPRFGVEGAAVSSVLADVTLLLLYAQGAARHVDGIDIRSTFRIATIRSSLAYIGRSGTARMPPGG